MPKPADWIFRYHPPTFNSAQMTEGLLGEAIAAVGYSWANWEFRADGADIVIADATDPNMIRVRFEGAGLALGPDGRPTGLVSAVTIHDPASGTVLATGSYGTAGGGAAALDIAVLVDSVSADGPFHGTPQTNPAFFDILHQGAGLVRGSPQANDIIVYGTDDSFRGGGGGDYFFFFGAAALIHGGRGRDAIDFFTRDVPIDVNLATGRIDIAGAITPVRGIEILHGGDRGDLFRADPGTAGERLFGYGGRDTLIGQDGDRLSGGGGRDRLRLAGDDGTAKGGGGDDRLTGRGDGISLAGGRGDDLLVIRDGTGARLSGGAGIDEFVFDNQFAEATHTITDYEANEIIMLAGINTGSPESARVTVTADGADSIIEYADPGGAFTFRVVVLNTAPADIDLIFD